MSRARSQLMVKMYGNEGENTHYFELTLFSSNTQGLGNSTVVLASLTTPVNRYCN